MTKAKSPFHQHAYRTVLDLCKRVCLVLIRFEMYALIRFEVYNMIEFEIYNLQIVACIFFAIRESLLDKCQKGQQASGEAATQ